MLLAGCEAAPATRPGELGNGAFAWLCVTEADAACSSIVEPAPAFPRQVAVGGEFELRYLGADTTSPPVSGSVLLERGVQAGTFTAVAPGVASVLVYGGEVLVDFLHLELVDVELLSVAPGAAVADGLEVGEEGVLVVTPVAGGEVAAGSLPYAWSVDRPEVVSLEVPATLDDRVHLRGLSPGEAVVTVTTGASTAATTVRVPDPTGGAHTGDTADTGGAP